MKKVLMAIMLLPIVATADTEIVDGVEWTYSIVDGKAVVGGDGRSSTAVSQSFSGDLVVPLRLGGRPVVAIGDSAFESCHNITSVWMYEGIVSIGQFAFAYCFDLTSVRIPKSVTHIADYAFDNCWGLADENRFVIVRGVLYSYGGSQKNVVIPAHVLRIGPHAFNGMNKTYVESVVIPGNVKSIGLCAFTEQYLSPHQRSLRSVMIEEGVERIEDAAFYCCSALTSVNIPSSVTYLSESAFAGCTGLVEKPAPRGNEPEVQVVEIDGFTIRDGVLCKYTGDSTDIVIPEIVREIQSGVFIDPSQIKSVKFPDGLKVIGQSAFSGCSGLASVVIPSSVERIEWDAFGGCTGLTSVTILSGDVLVDEAAFGWPSSQRVCYCVPGYLDRLSDMLQGRFHVFSEAEGFQKVIFDAGKNGRIAAGERAVQYVLTGGSVSAPTVCPKYGKRFVGWDCAVDNVTMPMTVTARYEEIEECADDALNSVRAVLAYEDGDKLWVAGNGRFNGPAGKLPDGVVFKLYCKQGQAGEYFEVPISRRVVSDATDSDCHWTITCSSFDDGISDCIVRLFDTKACSYVSDIAECELSVEHYSRPDVFAELNESTITVKSGQVVCFDFSEDTAGMFSVGGRQLYESTGRMYWTVPELGEEENRGLCDSGRSYYAGFDSGRGVELYQPSDWKSCQVNFNYEGDVGVCDPGGTLGISTRISARYIEYDARGDLRFVLYDGFDGCYHLYIVTGNEEMNYYYVYGCPGWEVDAVVVDGERHALSEESWWSADVPLSSAKYHNITVIGKKIEYSIIYEGTEGVENDNPLSYTVDDNIVFAPLRDREHWRFVGWTPEAVPVDGQPLSDVTVSARWEWIDVESSIVYENLYGTSHENPSTYHEGTELEFSPPSERTGYAFSGWDPPVISAEMTGPQTVRANWKANKYEVVYLAAGGSGVQENTPCSYDQETVIADCAYSRLGYVFKGWATEEDGEVVYVPGQKVTNLAANDGDEVALYAVWEKEKIEDPVIVLSSATISMTESCTVSITCETEGAIIYCRIGAVPRATDDYVYLEPITLTDTATVYAFAKKGDQQSATVTATVTKQMPSLAEAVGALGLSVATGGVAPWHPVADEFVDGDGFSARSGRMGAADDEKGNESWMEVSVTGAGTLSFWWRVDCEDDGPGVATWDRLVCFADGEECGRIDGQEEWGQKVLSFSTAGEHKVRWVYHKDDYDDQLVVCEDCGWVDGVMWTPSAAPAVGPTVEGDEGATVTGDAETGFVIKPSEGNAAVEVTIPQGVDAAKVTVEVSTKVASVKPNGAKVQIVNAGADITEFLNVPAADGNGVVDLTKAAVKEEIVKEAMDPAKGAEIKLDAANPKLTTPNTRVGLSYQLREGATLGGMKDGDSTVGNGQPWSPKITVKGGNSAFYSIGVGKGE